MSGSDLPSVPLLVYPNYVLDSFTWMFLEHLKLNMFTTKLLLSPRKLVSPRIPSVSVKDASFYMITETKT